MKQASIPKPKRKDLQFSFLEQAFLAETELHGDDTVENNYGYILRENPAACGWDESRRVP